MNNIFNLSFYYYIYSDIFFIYVHKIIIYFLYLYNKRKIMENIFCPLGGHCMKTRSEHKTQQLKIFKNS